MLHKDITQIIIGCAMKVHSTLGNGFQEVIYQRALAIELKLADLNFEREKEMQVCYKENIIGSVIAFSSIIILLSTRKSTLL